MRTAIAMGLAFGAVGAAQADEWPDPLRLAGARLPASADIRGAPFAEAPRGIHLAGSNEPSARESLFSTDQPDAKNKGISWSGFYGLGLDYTYASPAHWSRAVNRLQFDIEGALSESVKYKLGGRVDADPVYAGSDFYRSAVKRDQRLDAIWRENYLDISAGDWDFRVGAQQIIWGEVVGLFFADVVSARDLRDFLLPSFDIIRIPQWAARAEYYAGDSHLELVWIPVPTFDNIGKPGAEFYPLQLPSPTSDAAASAIRDIEKPQRKLGNSNYGFRVNTLAAGWDVAAFYYRSFSTEPTFYLLPGTTLSSPVFQPRYDRIWQVGATVTKDMGSFVLRGEGVYARGQNFSSTDPNAADGVVRRSTLDYILSADFPFPNDTRLNVQAFQRVYFGGSRDVAINIGDYGVSMLVSTKLTRALEPQLQWIQTFGGGGGLIRPKLTWYAQKNVTIGTGVDIFTGPNDGYFGRFTNRDRLYAEVRYDF